MWIQYDFNPHHNIRVGNFLQPFGYQSVTTTNNKPSFEAPMAATLFNPGLQLGVMYTFTNPSFYSSSSFHVESNALTNIVNYPLFNQQGYSLLTRFVWHKKNSNIDYNPLIHAGLSLGFSTPEKRLVNEEDIHDGFYNSVPFPTRVSNETAISITVADSKNRFKLTPELLLAYKKIALESQYFFQTIARKNNLNSINSQSVYAILRGIIIGGNYSYDYASATLVNPKKNALECVLNYNYASLNDVKAGIMGGRANNFNVTFNYYFNPYITARLNYSYTYVWGRPDITSITQNAFQLRLMVLF